MVHDVPQLDSDGVHFQIRINVGARNQRNVYIRRKPGEPFSHISALPPFLYQYGIDGAGSDTLSLRLC
jgi:hypothetical protein